MTSSPRNDTRRRARAVPMADGRPFAWLVGLLAALAVMMAAAAAQARSAPDSFADLAEKLLPSVVNISTTQVVEGHERGMPQLPPGSPFEEFFKDFFDKALPQQRERKATSLGSGFIIDAEGYIVTNDHVIKEADEITVILQDNTRLEADVIGIDSKTDIAVLKVDAGRKLPAVSFGDSDDTRVGDWVVAIGNPFGLGGTVTAGIVSASNRDINSGPYDDYLQTDASINRGNSGGPLFNLDGEVIGINTAIFSPSGGSVGIGFARSSASAVPVVKQLIKHGEVRRGWLGVRIQTVNEEIAQSLGLDEARGALVASVTEDGPAAAAGIKPGDVILEFNGESVPEMRKLPRMVAETAVGEEVPVVLWRDGKRKSIEVELGRLDEEELATATEPAMPDRPQRGGGEVDVGDLGLTMSAVTDNLRNRFELPEDLDGVVVTDVDPRGPAAAKGIRPGDLVLEVNQRQVSNPAEVEARIKEVRAAGDRPVLLTVYGQDGRRFVAIRLGKE